MVKPTSNFLPVRLRLLFSIFCALLALSCASGGERSEELSLLESAQLSDGDRSVWTWFSRHPTEEIDRDISVIDAPSQWIAGKAVTIRAAVSGWRSVSLRIEEDRRPSDPSLPIDPGVAVRKLSTTRDGFDRIVGWELSVLRPGDYTFFVAPSERCRAWEVEAGSFHVEGRRGDDPDLMRGAIQAPIEGHRFADGETVKLVGRAINRRFASQEWILFRDGREQLRLNKRQARRGVSHLPAGDYVAVMRVRSFRGVEQDEQRVAFSVKVQADTEQAGGFERFPAVAD